MQLEKLDERVGRFLLRLHEAVDIQIQHQLVGSMLTEWKSLDLPSLHLQFGVEQQQGVLMQVCEHAASIQRSHVPGPKPGGRLISRHLLSLYRNNRPILDPEILFQQDFQQLDRRQAQGSQRLIETDCGQLCVIERIHCRHLSCSHCTYILNENHYH